MFFTSDVGSRSISRNCAGRFSINAMVAFSAAFKLITSPTLALVFCPVRALTRSRPRCQAWHRNYWDVAGTESAAYTISALQPDHRCKLPYVYPLLRTASQAEPGRSVEDRRLV